MKLTEIERYKSFGGEVIYYRHDSLVCQSAMTFSVYLPPQAKAGRVPVLYFLSGLTCNHENFITKSGVQRYADEHGIALVMPDTSPRALNLSEAAESYDLGYGAGFYVNATQAPWSSHFNLYDYVVNELPAVCRAHLPIQAGKAGIMGHSMGGHGALMIALRNPDAFHSVSAFAPICAPSESPWGQKAFTAYLGKDKAAWAAYDTCQLIEVAKITLPLFVDQGTADAFLKTELHLDRLEAVCEKHGYPLCVKRRESFDHGYYYIASFIGEHIAYHAKFLGECK